MLLLDAKKLWEEGGYALNNPFDVSIARIKRFGVEHQVDADQVDLLLIELFIELRENPGKYRTEGNVCACGCGITNSGTNIIHEMFNRIRAIAMKERVEAQRRIADAFNRRVVAYMEAENAKYLAENGPIEEVAPVVKWYSMPTFKRWLGL